MATPGFDLSGIGAGMFGLLSSMLTWALVLFGMIILVVVILKIRQSKKFKFPILEVTGLGQGKVAVHLSKAGWFKKQRKFFGLLEVAGEQELICKDGKRRVHNISSTDYHEFNNKRCIIAKRKDVLKIITAEDAENLKRTLDETVQPILAVAGLIGQQKPEIELKTPVINLPTEGRQLLELVKQHLKAKGG